MLQSSSCRRCLMVKLLVFLSCRGNDSSFLLHIASEMAYVVDLGGVLVLR